MASVLEVSSLSAQYWIFCASAVVTRRLIATVRDSSPFGGLPVLGDTQFTSLSHAYIYYVIRAGKSRGFIKNVSHLQIFCRGGLWPPLQTDRNKMRGRTLLKQIALDKAAETGIINTGRHRPQTAVTLRLSSKRSNRPTLASWDGYFLLLLMIWITRLMTPRITRQNWNRSE